MSQNRYSPASPEWLVISLLLCASVLAIMHSDWLWRWDHLLYDAQNKTWARPAPEDIVIVAIDEHSLSQLGRWPWSRRLHAELLHQLSDAGARAVVLDILFAEPDQADPEADRALIEAVRANGRVILPLAIERSRLGGRLVETLPLQPLQDAAAAVGHVHIELDPDGIARRLYLKQGLGFARWSHLSIALLRLLQPAAWQSIPGARNPSDTPTSAQTIVLDNLVMVPFSGPPGHFPRIPYVQVLDGETPRQKLQDKIVLVGVTAVGLGDSLPTPVSGRNQPMPGVEINATLIDALRLGIGIRPLPTLWQSLLAGVLLLTPLLSMPRLLPRTALALVGAMLLLTLAISGVLLHVLHFWFPPSALLLGLAVSYPLYSWRRLEHTVRYFDQELKRLKQEPSAVSFYGESLQIADALEFLRRIIPFDGWQLRDEKGRTVDRQGALPAPLSGHPSDSGWTKQGNSRWIGLAQGAALYQLGLCWQQDALDPDAEALLTCVAEHMSRPAAPVPQSTVELIESQIRDTQDAIYRLRAMRRFVSDTLDQMVDGLLVVNPFGQTVLANHQAACYLGYPGEHAIAGSPILELLEKLEIQDNLNWARVLVGVLLAQKAVSFEGRKPEGGELLIQISPLSIEDFALRGMIVVIADISRLKQSERRRAQALSFLSHDLRSPITSLLSLAQKSRQHKDGFSVESFGDQVARYADRALRLSEDFLQLARAESSEQASFRDTDVVTVAHNALDEMYTRAQDKSVKLRRRIALDEAWVRADAGLLERALINLLENAIRYGPAQSEVVLEVHGDDQQVSCCVQDQGPGIPADQLERIFQPFRRGEGIARQEKSGAGLGLAFVQVVARKHLGTVDVTSTPGQGARFCLHLPMTADSQD